jgi:hypothetical protein
MVTTEELNPTSLVITGIDILNIFFYLSITTSAIPVLLLFFLRKSISYNSSEFKFWLQLLTVERFAANLGILILMFTLKNSIPIYHFSVLLEFVIISKLFDLKKKQVKLNLLVCCAIIAFLSDLFVTSDLLHLNAISSILTYSMIIGLGWNYLYSDNSPKERSIALISIFLYYLGSIFYLLCEKYLLKNQLTFEYGFIVLAILSLLFNLSNSYSIWSLRKN